MFHLKGPYIKLIVNYFPSVYFIIYIWEALPNLCFWHHVNFSLKWKGNEITKERRFHEEGWLVFTCLSLSNGLPKRKFCNPLRCTVYYSLFLIQLFYLEFKNYLKCLLTGLSLSLAQSPFLIFLNRLLRCFLQSSEISILRTQDKINPRNDLFYNLPTRVKISCWTGYPFPTPHLKTLFAYLIYYCWY
jgi:hypothetical protein